MFAKTIVDSDVFLDMPLSSQSLYFHLSMRADDDGFINNPKKIQRMIGSSDDDLKLLIAKQFIIPFENGIVVIKHWRIHNYIQKDRYKKTIYQEEKNKIIADENNVYILDDSNSDTRCIQDVSNSDTQVRLGKVSIGKVSIEKHKVAIAPVDLFSSHTENKYLVQALKDFKEMRIKTRKPLTLRATQLLLKRLIKLSGGDEQEQIDILEQSILNSWQNIYEIKDVGSNAKQATRKNKQVEERDWGKLCPEI